MTEQELIANLQEGNEQAFTLMVNRYQHRVFNTAIGLLQHAGDAEDIAQEVFIQVYKSIGQFKSASTLSTWIYRITITKSLDHLRSKKRKKRFGFITGLFGEDNKALFEPVNFCHPGVELDKKEEAIHLFKMINLLPETQKTAFILNKLEDMSYQEIAGIMQTTASAVDSLLQRAKKNLRRMLESQQKSEPGNGNN